MATLRRLCVASGVLLVAVGLHGIDLPSESVPWVVSGFGALALSILITWGIGA